MSVDVLTQKKELFLAKLKEKSNFATLKDQDEWEFHDLLSLLTDDEDFKQICIDKAATESAGKSFKEDIDKCIELAEQGKKTASKYFKKGVKLQAYYTKINNADRVFNVNLIHYDKSEPTRISDILQQEKDIKELNIYCNKKHEIHAHREGKKRHYKFKEGADYEMTSTWPVKDEFGNVSICTMIMNISSDGITKILKFNGEDFVPSEEILELIKQNDELYIQGLSLYDAVLEKGKAMAPLDVIPAANNNLQNESIVAYRKEPEGELDPKVDADNSLPPSINSNVSTQTEVASQQIETQTEVNLQHTGTQTEVASQQMDELILNNQMLSEENVELKQEMSNLKKEAVELKQEIEAGLQVINKKHHELIQENQRLQEKLETTQAEAEQRIEALEKQTSELKDKLEKKKRGFEVEINAMCKEFKENLERKEEEFKSVYEEKRKLEDKLKIVNAGKEELKSELKELKKELHQVQEGKSDLKDKHEKELSYLEGVTQELNDELKNELKREKEKCKQLLEEENEWGDELVEMLDKLSKIIGETVDKPCSNITEHLSRVETKELIVNKLTSMKRMLTGNVSNEPDDVPPKKRKLSRSLSVDSGFDNNEENCDDCSSVLVIKSVSPPEDRKEVARLLSVRN